MRETKNLKALKKVVLILIGIVVLVFTVRSILIFKDLGALTMNVKEKLEKGMAGADVIYNAVVKKNAPRKEQEKVREQAVAKMKELEKLGNELQSLRPNAENQIKSGLTNIITAFTFYTLLFLTAIFWKTT